MSGRSKLLWAILFISLLLGSNPEVALRYVLDHQKELKIQKIVFSTGGLELFVKPAELPLIYSRKKEIGFEKAELFPLEKDKVWKVLLRFPEKKDTEERKIKGKESVLTKDEIEAINDLRSNEIPMAREYSGKTLAKSNQVKAKKVKISVKKKRSGSTKSKNSISGLGNNLQNLKVVYKQEKAGESNKTQKSPFEQLPERYSTLSENTRKGLLEKVTVTFKEVPIIAFFDYISQKLNISIVPVGTLPGKSLELFIEKTPLYKVIDIVLIQNGLSLFVESKNIIVVGSLKKIEELKKNRILLERLEAGDDKVEVVRIKNSNIGKIKESLKLIFGKYLKLSEIKESEVLLISGPEKLVNRAKEVVKKIDRPKAQILIKARVVEISENEIKNLGIRWSFKGVSPSGANGLPVNIKTYPGLPAQPSSNSQDSVRALTENPAVSQGIKIGVPYNLASLEFSLSALEKKGKARVVAEPAVVLEEGSEGQILQTKEIPYSFVNNWLANVSFRQAGLILKVVPSVVDQKNKLIKIKVRVESSSPDFSNPVNGLPPIDRQGVEVVNVIKDGEFQILGGLKVKRTSSNSNGVPVLSSIPLIKNLFKSRDRRKDNYELLILLMPKIQSF